MKKSEKYFIIGALVFPIIFFTINKNEIEILHVFIKKDEKTPKHDLDLAIKRYKEAKNDK